MNWEKFVFHWEKLIFEPTGNSANRAELLALGKTLNFYSDHLMFCLSRQHVKWKHLQVQVYFQQ